MESKVEIDVSTGNEVIRVTENGIILGQYGPTVSIIFFTKRMWIVFQFMHNVIRIRHCLGKLFFQSIRNAISS